MKANVDLAAIGSPPWTRSDILASIDEFSTLYGGRPVRNNQGGMLAPHMFALWFMARRLVPELIVESGVWKGQSTWVLEQACPSARLYSIDPNLTNREYVSDHALYRDTDFSQQDWTSIPERSLAFFDDHKNAYRRLQQCLWFGFKHVIFEDNYPVSRGDCYSLKKAFAGTGFDSRSASPWWSRERWLAGVRRVLLARLAPSDSVAVAANDVDARHLRDRLDVYYEFPPLFKLPTTRWGDRWEETTYPTPAPLLERKTKPAHDLFLNEAASYTWMCYAKLK